MGEYLADDVGIFDAGDDLHGIAAGLAGFDIDAEYALKPLGPCHGDTATWRSAGVWSCVAWVVVVLRPLPRPAGVVSARC